MSLVIYEVGLNKLGFGSNFYEGHIVVSGESPHALLEAFVKWRADLVAVPTGIDGPGEKDKGGIASLSQRSDEAADDC